MFKLTKLITAGEGADHSRLQAALNVSAQWPGVVRSLLSPTLPDAWNGGDYIWHVQFGDEAVYREWQSSPAGGKTIDAVLGDSSQVKLVESVAYQGGRSGSRPGTVGTAIYRTMLCAVDDRAYDTAIRKFEDEIYGMGSHIHTIRTWQVSRVMEASGTCRWSHVWEQDYEDLSGLQGAYMKHPYHWALVDRWFDPQCTDCMFEQYSCNSFCNSADSMISPGAD